PRQTRAAPEFRDAPAGEIRCPMSSERILLTISEVATLTGFHEGTLRHWVSEGRIPFVRISARCVRFRRDAIERWLAALAIEPRRDGEQQRAKGTVRQIKAVTEV